MKKFWIKLLSDILFFYDKQARKKFRQKYNDASNYVRSLRKKGIAIGFGTYIAPGVHIRDKRTVIGKYCSIARNSTIGTGRHPLDALSTHSMVHRECCTEAGPIGLAPENRVEFEQTLPVTVGSDVWIGLNAVIMDGIKIGNGAVIGTNAIVTKDVPPYAIVVGIPAKVLRYRFDDETVARLEKLRWFDRDPEFIKRLPMGNIPECLEILEKTGNAQ
ncbi:MAG: CatB-related O-acetyltransferase [Lentisphaeria bacterium]|nr:CatB-related O-acetyltransferase [Lentisphaeria bacterium]